MTFSNNAESTPPPHANFGLASMFALRSMTVRRDACRHRGTIQGIDLPTLLRDLEARPSASWILNRPRSSGDATWACRVTGPVEPRDSQAVTVAVERLDDPLDFELRADLYLHGCGTTLRYTCNGRTPLLSLAAVLLRRHATAALGQAAMHVPAPEPGVVDALFSDHGLALRSLETEVYPGFVDIGVADAVQESPPSTRSVIFDRVTNTWHTD